MKKPKYTECMTLRLEPHIHDLVIEAAYNRRSTIATWIRSSIRRSLGVADQYRPNQRCAEQPVVR